MMDEIVDGVAETLGGESDEDDSEDTGDDDDDDDDEEESRRFAKHFFTAIINDDLNPMPEGNSTLMSAKIVPLWTSFEDDHMSVIFQTIVSKES
nr:unnamed protein product [Callosobruchus chinensis]